jgi:aminoglycoside phosphotransferase (APT) family kinase protein
MSARNQIARWLGVVAAARAAGADSWTADDVTVLRLNGGFNNALYRIDAGDQQVACKLCVIDRRRRAVREYGAMRLLRAAGLDIAPQPLALDESCDVLPYPTVIYRWLVGQPVPPSPSQAQLAALLDSLHQMHSLRPSAAMPDAWFHWFHFGRYLDEMDSLSARYAPWLRANDPDGPALGDRIARLRDHCALMIATTTADPGRQNVPLRLCRSDTNLANAIWGDDGRVRWVDWEFSGWGDPAMELAELRWHAGYLGLSPAQHTWLRQNYRRPADDPGFEERLAVWDCLIVTRWCQLILRTLWSAHNGPDRVRLTWPDLDPVQLRARLLHFVERAEEFVNSAG